MLLLFSQRAIVQSYPILIVVMGYGIQDLFNSSKKRLVLMGFIVMTLGLNQFQSWQYNRGIIHQERMTQAAYFNNFFKTDYLSPEDKKYFLVERASGAEEHFNIGSTYKKAHHFNVDFEEGLPFEDEETYMKIARSVLNKPKKDKSFALSVSRAHSGKYSFEMNDSLEFSPAISKSFEEIVSQDYAWIRSGAWVFLEESIEPNEVFWINTFTYNGKNYKYRGHDLSTMNLKVGEWNYITSDYMTPEVRSKSDRLKVYLWNKNKKKLYLDDLQIDVYEQINVYY